MHCLKNAGGSRHASVSVWPVTGAALSPGICPLFACVSIYPHSVPSPWANKSPPVSHKFNLVGTEESSLERIGMGAEVMRLSEVELGRTYRILALVGASFLLGGLSSAQARELTPAETVAFRFPPNWPIAQAPKSPQTASTSASQRSRSQRVASLQPITSEPAYTLASADTRPERATQASGLQTAALGYASPETEAAARRAPAVAAVERATAAPQHARHASIPAAPHPVKQSPNVFTDSQIDDLRAKLRLSPRQQTYWPAVASALRNIDYVKHQSGTTKAIDPDSPGVQQLKSAAFPLILSFDETQKNHVRQLARNMGLEDVASSF